MDDDSHKNHATTLILNTDEIGKIVIDPAVYDRELAAGAELVIFPHKLSGKSLQSCVEWAAETQAPIICLASELPFLEKEGFGSYRFLKVESYKELFIKRGSLEFFPAPAKKPAGLYSVKKAFMELLGITPDAESFHVVVRARKNKSFLYLASPYVDPEYWTLMKQASPERVVVSRRSTRLEWFSLFGPQSGSNFPTFEVEGENELTLDWRSSNRESSGAWLEIPELRVQKSSSAS